MPTARYFRLIGIGSNSATMTLTEIALYSGASRVDGSATITSTIAPSSGTFPGPVSFDKAGANGFAIEFDIGTDTDVTGFGLRSPSAETFPKGATFQHFAGGVWVTTYHDLNLQWVSSATLAQYTGDPFWKDVALLLKFDGANGATTTVDSSPVPRAVTLLATAALTTAEAKFGASSLNVTNQAQQVRAEINTTGLGLNFDLPELTIELFYKPSAFPAVDRPVVACYNGNDLSALMVQADGVVKFRYNFQVGVDYRGGVALTLNAWNHIAVVKRGTTWQVFVNGVGGTTGTFTYGVPSVTSITLGTNTAASFSGCAFGFYDHFRYTRAARYTADFTPLAAPDDIYTLTPISNEVQSPARTIRLQRGFATYTGTVKERGTPSNLSLARRVQLIDERSGNVIAQTWSSATTGEYTFTDLDPALRYTVVSFDHTETNWPPVIADNLQATP